MIQTHNSFSLTIFKFSLSTKKYFISSILIAVLISSFVFPNSAYAGELNICHKAGGNYNRISVGVSSWSGGGHSSHVGDYIDSGVLVDGVLTFCTGTHVETTAPIATITYSVAGPYKSGTPIRITILWNENVQSSTEINTIAISGSNTLSSTSSTLDTNVPSGRSFYYDYTVGAGNGIATVTVSGKDIAGNTGTHTSTFTVDNTSPTVTLTTTAPNPVNTAFQVTATFSESVTGLTVGDLSVTNGVASSLSGSGTTYTFTVTPNTNGAVTIQIPSNSVQDSATNNNVISNQLSRTYDSFITTIPDAPTGLTRIGGNQHTSLSWTAPVNTGGLPLTDYIIRTCQNNCNIDASWSIFNDGPASTVTSGNVTGLTNGVEYTFKVNAVNNVGRGTNSTTQTMIPGILPTTSEIKIIPGNGQAKIQFIVPSENPSWTGVKILKFNHSINSFVTLYESGNSNSTITDGTGTSREVLITGLSNDQKYSLKVMPINHIGNGSSTHNVVIIPTSETSPLLVGNYLKFYQPPLISTSNLNKLQTYGLTDLTIPSPGLINLNQINPFDKGINQKILLTSTITKDTTMNTVLNTYGVPTYTSPSDWNSTNVFTVPPTIIPVTSSGSTIGQQAVYSVETISPQKPILMALNNAEKISSIKGMIAGVSFTLNATATATKFNMTSTYTTTPPTGVAQVSDALMYMNFNTATTSGVNFGKSSSFDSTPSVSFTLGPQSGSTSSSSPTNTVNSAITCPQPIVSYIADDGTVSTTGITISRNISGDDSTSCGYTSTLQHFSSYAVSASIVSSSTTQTGNSPKLPPQLVNDPYVIRIANSKYKINELSSLSPAVFPVGIPIEIEILIKDSKGPENISHVELFLNKHDGKVLNDLSETMIIYDRFNGNGLLDRNDLVDSYTIIPTTKNGNASFIFKIIFKNQMQESDLVFRIWDIQRNGLNLHIPNALEIISSSPQINICHIPPQTNQKPETITITKSELEFHLSHGDTTGKCLEKSALKEWVRYYIELWQFGIIDDSTFKEGFNHLIDQRIIEIDQNENERQAVITSDFKKNAMDWYQNNITNDDFLSLIKKLVQ